MVVLPSSSPWGTGGEEAVAVFHGRKSGSFGQERDRGNAGGPTEKMESK